VTVTDLSQKLKQIRSYCSFAALLLVLLLVIRSLAGYSQSTQVPPSRPVQSSISVNTELVVLPVRVSDANGDFVPGLSVDNFRLYEEGRQQRITLFQQEDTPVTVGLVVDRSSSMRPNLGGVVTAIISFAHSSNPQDEMFVMDFGDTVSIEMPSQEPFTHDPAELARALSSVSANGGTALYDAVYEGLKHLELTDRDKRALIIVSDGADNASKHKYAEVLALARQSQAVIYSIGLIDAPDQEVDRRILQRLCHDTGGIAFFPEGRETVASASDRIARLLREQYTLGFAPDRTGNERRFRKVQVKVAASGRGKILVQTRPGYFLSGEPVTIEKRVR
jgi:Ca-activated chloride channel homolog